MPYDLKKVKDGYKVWSANSGYHSKKPLTLRMAKQQLKAIYANTGGK